MLDKANAAKHGGPVKVFGRRAAICPNTHLSSLHFDHRSLRNGHLSKYNCLLDPNNRRLATKRNPS